MNDEHRCQIRFGWATSNIEIVLTCELGAGHDGEHEAMWEHGMNATQPMTMIAWLTDDRRSFAGEWKRCPALQDLCVLPDGHPGNHAA